MTIDESLERAFDLRGTPCTTRRTYRYCIDHFEDFVGRDVTELGRREVDQFLLHLVRERHLSGGETFAGVMRRRQRARVRPPKGKAQRMFVVTASAHYSDEGSVVARVDELLGGTAEYWCRGRSQLLEQVRTGDWCLYIDTLDGDIEVVAVTDIARDGKYIVFAFEELWQWRPFKPRLRDELATLGLRRSRKALSGQWVPSEKVLEVARVVHPDANWDADVATK